MCKLFYLVVIYWTWHQWLKPACDDNLTIYWTVSMTTWVGWCQNVKAFWIFLQQKMMAVIPSVL